MSLARHLKLALTLGALVASSVATSPASPSAQKPLDDDGDNDDTPLPLVIWHGLGDDYAASGLRQVGELAEAANPGTLVYFVRMDESASADRTATFSGNVTEQVAKVCADLAAHPILSTAPAVDALGFSQGGQFLRAYVERCNRPPVRSLVTFGSQHNGITDFRACAPRDFLCRGIMYALKNNAWSRYVQGSVVPAQYFRNPTEYDKYLEYSNFLADVNNEREYKNATYKENIAALVNFVMYMFEDDTTAIPKESAWFEEINGTEATPLRARKLYTEDWLGLRALDRKGGLRFRLAPGEHMQIEEALLNATFKEFYGPLKKTFSREAPVDNISEL
ncbi:Palmitoyl-protein thioesterase 1 [Pleurostoma richardsiae]|uniref:Palmitoyl-protein thioesterase 1 n=1 Tax=Pleurostoma richardsiae TaxID=41990 RepID=A0AA38R8N4_9PEZI|nr:Palmitoyl-protein thioesterase 1 [Pleurostoma richardsiae]